MEGLANTKRLLLRAKYHTDQIEGALHYAGMEEADINAVALAGERVASSVELCICPVGYAGTSCHKCAYGYKKASKDALAKCTKCDCNGHSPSCDYQGKCLVRERVSHSFMMLMLMSFDDRMGKKLSVWNHTVPTHAHYCERENSIFFCILYWREE